MAGRCRVFVPPAVVGQTRITFTGETLRHLRKVLRLKEGDLLLVTDGTGLEYLARLDSGGPREVTAEIVEKGRCSRESPLRTILAQAVPKGDRMSLVLQKAVEMGVSEIWPLSTSRTVVSLTGERAQHRGERWRKIIRAAVGQSGRTRAPELSAVQTWEECVARNPGADLKLILLEEERRGLGELLRRGPPPASVFLAVGPEGGWAEAEVELARQAGFQAVRLGPRVLRTETVGLVALGILQFLFGDLS